MPDYLQVTKSIHDWLTKFQLTQQFIQAEIRDNHIFFGLNHPTEGEIQVSEKLSAKSIFLVHGIALEIVEKNKTTAKLRLYDFGGIWDPVDKRVMGEHYSTSHYALLSGILFNAFGDHAYLQQAKDAFDFHLHTSSHEYYYSDWMYHWDFQNYALLECYSSLHTELDANTIEKWKRCLKHWKTNARNRLGNWSAMRALAYLQRYDLFKSIYDYYMFKWNYYLTLRGERADGCFDDEKDMSRPIQYHIYTVALLHRMFLLNGHSKIGTKFLKGVDFFLPFIDPDGDFNYWGRGHGQIFGYGAGIYALNAAAIMTGDNKYQQAADRLFNYLIRFQTDGHFPLVLNSHADEKRIGWYDYHHTTVYNAFLGVWLALTNELSKKQSAIFISEKRKPVKQTRPNFTFISNKAFFIAFGNSMPHYSSEVGLSPCHIWIKDMGWLFSCPGGPTPETFGKRFGHKHILRNVFAPIVIDDDNQLITLAGKMSNIETSSKNKIACSSEYRICRVNRVWSLTDARLEIWDTVTFKAEVKVKEFRLFNLPLVTDKFNYEVQRDNLVIKYRNNQIIIRCAVEGLKTDWEVLETIHTVKGVAQVLTERIKDTVIEKNQKFEILTHIYSDPKQIETLLQTQEELNSVVT